MDEMTNRLLNPPFAQDPPVKLDIDAKILGIIIAILSAIGVIAGLFGLLALLGFSALLAAAGASGIVFLAWIGVLAGLVADVMSLLGGWQMYQGIADGKRLVIYGLAIGFVAQIVSALGYASIGSLILPILVILVVYYLVVISRFPGPAPSV
ncbi:MAG: hypothetical protein E6H92_14200 [Chloroflexi bacterium]|nr:MAG: hypothetical protein E6H92_14200 [Chloroflexota bacterium]